MAEVSLARWLPHLEAAERAGLSLSAYARQHGLSRHTLYVARKQWRTQNQPATPMTSAPVTPQRFIAVHAAAAVSRSTPAALEVRLSGGVALAFAELPDRAWLAPLLQALASAP